MLKLYTAERHREEGDLKAQARTTAFELAYLLAPLFGGEVKEARGDERPLSRHEHTFVDGACTGEGCDVRITDGTLHNGPLPVECDEHVFVGDVCERCGGRKLGGDHWWVTKATPRIIGPCEHKRHQPTSGGELVCLDCGSRGN